METLGVGLRSASESPAEVKGRVEGIVWNPLEIGLSFPTGTGAADCSEGEGTFAFIWEKENGPHLLRIWEKTNQLFLSPFLIPGRPPI